MKQFSIIFILTTLTIAVFFLLSPPPSGNSTTSLPWQIENHSNGNSTVFGITLGATTLNQASDTLGINREAAVLIDKNDHARLEIYYSHFRSGPLTGKLIITADTTSQLALNIAEKITDGEYLSTGSRRFNLGTDELKNDGDLLVKTLTFIPSSNLDEKIIRSRFGTPAQIIPIEQSQHFLYPDKGLDIVLNKEGKETLQYIAPKNFELLRQPLQSFLVQGTSKNVLFPR